MGINFKTYPVEYEIGDPKATDIRKTIGNEINKNTSDIGLSDLAREIYYSEGEIEIPENYKVLIIRIISESPVILGSLKKSLIASFTKGNKNNNSPKNKTK